MGESKVALAVAKTGLQRFRDFDVVFEQVGDTYEVRMLELGRADATRVEVLAGLEAGARYVHAEQLSHQGGYREVRRAATTTEEPAPC